MAAYLIYSLLDWPGISTAITTCFFVALGSLGETVHKLTLRLSGALIGGLGGGLAIVYLLPEMTNIGQLCLLVAGASVAFGWVATGSDRIAYAGMQMAFAFFLGVLQGDGPATDLTVLRDRAVGILLGNLLMTLVFGVLWPTSAVARSRLSAAAALRALGRLLADATRAAAGPRLDAVRALAEARRFAAIAAFELRMLPARGRALPPDTLDRLAGAVFVVADQPPAAGVRDEDRAAAAWLAACADRLASEKATALPDVLPVPAPPPGDAPIPLRAAAEARALLQSEIIHAVTAET